MGQIPNIKRIRTEDFSSEYQSLIDKLSFSLNSFMEETINSLNKNIDFNNLAQYLRVIRVKIGTGGVPKNELKVNTGTTRKITGISVIKASRKDNVGGNVDSHPFITFEQQSQTIIKITHIAGLQDASEYDLTVIMFT